MFRLPFKNQEGFTLIEVLVVVVIIAILAAISVPIYIQYVEGARASDAQATIGAIYNACKMYYQDHSDYASDVVSLENEGYLTIDESTKKQWDFELVGDPITQIIATSTPEMRGGAGHVVIYNVDTGKFEEYGMPSDAGEGSGGGE